VALIRHDLGKGQAGSIIDADVDELPTRAADLIAPVVGDAMTWAHDFAELFDIEMEQFARELALVAPPPAQRAPASARR